MAIKLLWLVVKWLPTLGAMICLPHRKENLANKL
jgi:hypothetical protein